MEPLEDTTTFKSRATSKFPSLLRVKDLLSRDRPPSRGPAHLPFLGKILLV